MLPNFLSNFENWDSNHIFGSLNIVGGTSNSVADLDYDLSVVITSNLIPTHPSISFVNRTIASLLRLDGLPMDVPIYVTIDQIPSNRKDPNKTSSDHHRRSEYIHRLRTSSFSPFTNIHVLEMTEHRHISGSVNQALRYISKISKNNPSRRFDPSEHFVYLLQHDLYFNESVPHEQLVEAMRESPNELKNIRFRFDNWPGPEEDLQDLQRYPPCQAIENGMAFERNGLSFFATSKFSDHNQLSTLQYYQDMIVHIQNTTKNGRLNLPMEWVLRNSAINNCLEWGQQVLGDRLERLVYLGHLDGRNTQK